MALQDHHRQALGVGMDLTFLLSRALPPPPTYQSSFQFHWERLLASKTFPSPLLTPTFSSAFSAGCLQVVTSSADATGFVP